jgi:hypothetical protein
MREILFGCALASVLAGCSTLPDPDPKQAWIDLHPRQDSSLRAEQIDAKDWTDKRYFEVEPGSHELTVRYQFAVDPTNIGPDSGPLWRNCQLNLRFKDFNAGERYQLEAGSLGFRPWAKLYDQQRNIVGQAKPAGCQGA